MHRNTSSLAALALSIASLGAVTAGGCTSVLGINKDYRELDGGAGGGSSSSGPMASSSGSTGAGTSSSSSSSGAGGGNLPMVIWEQRLGGPGIDLAGHPGLDVSPNGGVFITGAFQKPIDLGNGALSCTTPQCLFLAKLDQLTGKSVWSWSLADTSGLVSSLAATPDGGVVVAGTFSTTFTPPGMVPVPSSGAHDMFLAKFDSAGVCQWHFAFGDVKDQRANVVAVDDKGMIYLAGSFFGSFPMNACPMSELNGPNAFLAQFDSGGNCQWVRRFDAPSDGLSLAPIGAGIAFGGSFTGTIMLGGGLSITSMNNPSPFLTAFDAVGNPLSAKAFSGMNITLASNQVTAGAAFALTSLNGFGSPIGIGSLSNDGLTLSPPVPIPGTEQGYLESIAPTPVGRQVLTGYSVGDLTLGKPIKNNGAQDIFLAHLDKSASVLSGAGYGDAMSQAGRNVRSDAGGNIYLFGDFQGTVDFGSGTLISAGSSDMFLVKFSDLSFP